MSPVLEPMRTAPLHVDDRGSLGLVLLSDRLRSRAAVAQSTKTLGDSHAAAHDSYSGP
jgi:hypothetical protein